MRQNLISWSLRKYEHIYIYTTVYTMCLCKCVCMRVQVQTYNFGHTFVSFCTKIQLNRTACAFLYKLRYGVHVYVCVCAYTDTECSKRSIAATRLFLKGRLIICVFASLTWFSKLQLAWADILERHMRDNHLAINV